MSDEKSSKGSWHGGKGSLHRKGTNHKAYQDNWEMIFGKNKPSHEAIEIIMTAQNTDKKDSDNTDEK